jgi:hypothetical protein
VVLTSPPTPGPFGEAETHVQYSERLGPFRVARLHVSKIQNLETSLAKPELVNCCTEIDDEPIFCCSNADVSAKLDLTARQPR